GRRRPGSSGPCPAARPLQGAAEVGCRPVRPQARRPGREQAGEGRAAPWVHLDLALGLRDRAASKQLADNAIKRKKVRQRTPDPPFFVANSVTDRAVWRIVPKTTGIDNECCLVGAPGHSPAKVWHSQRQRCFVECSDAPHPMRFWRRNIQWPDEHDDWRTLP